MLALPQRRQHLAQHHPTPTLPSPSSPQHISFDHLSDHLSHQLNAQQLVDSKLLNDYLESQQQTFAQSNVVVDALPNPFMTGAFDYSSPAIRIQQSTPTPQLAHSFSPSPMLSANATASGLDNWGAYSNVHSGSQSLQTPVQSRTQRPHQRASSSSSIASSGSQYQAVAPTASYPSFSNVSSVSNHLPTPTHTPTQDTFSMHPDTFNTYPPNTQGMDHTMAAHMSMKQALMDQHDDDVPGFGHSARHSVSSYGHDSPATPHTAQGDDLDFKLPPNDLRQHQVPKLERTFTDVAADLSYDPNTVVPQAQSMPQGKHVANMLLSPYRTNPNDLIQRSLQAAQVARSQSPSNSASRGDSPFRRGSPYRHASTTFQQSPRVAVGSAAAAREQKVEADAAYAMKAQMSSSEEAQPKTISPKDALLDYRDADEDAKVPLFPDGGASEYDHQYHGGDQYRNATQSTFDTTSGQSYRRDSWATPQYPSNFSTSAAATSQPSTAFAFPQPATSGPLHGLPFTSTSQYRPTTMPSASEQTPEFPAHLTSMESSASEACTDLPGSQSSDHRLQLQKPTESTADTGTYTCTYHGCTQRFETPQKLQKHKREGHRNAAATTVGSGMTSAALLERNSQAGPHKCDRINPTTGKPCNTIFSRPYDLTRHEDTIHNVRKQKVRCALCVEEKTFSRNDALTRHMRVVHPEIDFPGKHRRRGANHD